ncbi:MAG: aminotransferase class V-fold PLP-dependent enzyme [Methanobacteriota archaeon]|nr:MAG: aminotransferase class V-fold PLP-dependent enzyme [Euryarchaeota archaeon]
MNIDDIRDLYPITKVKLPGSERCSPRDLIYFDHAASTHAPKPVLDAYIEMHTHRYANIHRGEHYLSQISSDMFDHVQDIIGDFLGVKDIHTEGIQGIITTNTTSSLDLASHVMAETPGKVLTTVMEHHSNILPHKRRSQVVFANVDENGMLMLDEIEDILQKEDIKLVAVSGGSNVTGYVPPVEKIARLAHDAGAKILVDAAQRIAHMKLEMKPSDHPEHLDFIAGAGHKFYAPFGSAFLMGPVDLFDQAPPYIPAGGTVAFVTTEEELYLNGPSRQTPGTPNIAGAVAMGEALKFLSSYGMETLRNHEMVLLEKMLKGLDQIDGVNVLGNVPTSSRVGVVSFTIDGISHSHGARLLDEIGGIACRNGCFCAHPYMLRLLNVPEEHSANLRKRLIAGEDVELPGAIRASIGIYNTQDEVDKFLTVVETIATKKDSLDMPPKELSMLCGIN